MSTSELKKGSVEEAIAHHPRPTLTVAEVAEIVGCSDKTVYSQIKQKKLEAHRIGTWGLRVDKADLLKWWRSSSTTSRS